MIKGENNMNEINCNTENCEEVVTCDEDVVGTSIGQETLYWCEHRAGGVVLVRASGRRRCVGGSIGQDQWVVGQRPSQR